MIMNSSLLASSTSPPPAPTTLTTLHPPQSSPSYQYKFKTTFNNNNSSNNNNNKQASNEIPPECTGCGSFITERYFLVVMNRAWHIQCLRCSECKICLDSQNSCFTKDGHIFCKDDYYK